ncbi:hypothetical protein XU18_1551 [Perkinsela sp. CCAP 1560/4]|nr:hypothetical protein XU18_1551 [Perkinsela sp. CCAP 1560/4]|eukprot:KNH07823.1 hypothetical protein XU18_1551 [Perkinsela sp. CCAP 1560/4]
MQVHQATTSSRVTLMFFRLSSIPISPHREKATISLFEVSAKGLSYDTTRLYCKAGLTTASLSRQSDNGACYCCAEAARTTVEKQQKGGETCYLYLSHKEAARTAPKNFSARI